MSLFWVKISIFIKNCPFFCNPTGKVFKTYSFYLSCFKLDATLFNLHIKPAKKVLFLPQKLTFFIQVYFGKCMFCYFIDIRALSYYENDVHIVNISNGNNIYHVL